MLAELQESGKVLVTREDGSTFERNPYADEKPRPEKVEPVKVARGKPGPKPRVGQDGFPVPKPERKLRAVVVTADNPAEQHFADACAQAVNFGIAQIAAVPPPKPIVRKSAISPWPSTAPESFEANLAILMELWALDRAWGDRDLFLMQTARFQLSRKRRMPRQILDNLGKMQKTWLMREAQRELNRTPVAAVEVES